MPQSNLVETLQNLVRRHGISSVLHSLAEIQSLSEPHAPSSPPKRTRKVLKNQRSAVEYVGKMTLARNKIEAMQRAAQMFEDKKFMPAIADIREFCRVYRVELPKSVSRASSIPRLFTFLSTMDTTNIIKLLDEGAFSGPTRLAPIADAIRDRSLSGRRNRRADLAESAVESNSDDSRKGPFTSQ